MLAPPAGPKPHPGNRFGAGPIDPVYRHGALPGIVAACGRPVVFVSPRIGPPPDEPTLIVYSRSKKIEAGR